MNTTELLKYHETICNEAREIMKKKNHDYSGSSGETPFANFMVAEQMDLCPAEIGILLRIGDKMKRINTFIKSDKLKVDESVRDSCRDCINYFILLGALIEDRRPVVKHEDSLETLQEAMEARQKELENQINKFKY